MCQSGMGVTIAFKDTEFTAKITGISGGNMVRDFYESTHFLSAKGTQFNGVRWMEQCEADMAKMDDIVVEILYDMDADPPIDQPIEEITIQSPPKPGQSAGAKLVIQGGMKQYNGASFGMKDRRRGQFTLAVSGPPEFTPGVAS